jgi:hypothetical protein|tara:strand:- start:960 stop:1154 length:195 start_codon:yes stop_codon:yes gene_type:complete
MAGTIIEFPKTSELDRQYMTIESQQEIIRNQAALIKKLQDEKKAKKELREEGESIEGEKLFLQD